MAQEIIFDTQYKDPYTPDERDKFNAAYPFPVCDTKLYEKLIEIDSRLVDPLWRINNLYYIINKQGKLVRFRLTKVQFRFLCGLHTRNDILKARQLGFTTTIDILLFDFSLFNSFKNVGIIAHTQPDAKIIFKKIKLAWEHFPQAIKDVLEINTISDSKSELELSNGSFFRVATSLRSGTYAAVHISELGKTSAQFPEKAEEIITGTLPTVEHGILFIESTAEGDQGVFYDICQEAMETMRRRLPLTKKDFKFFFFAWYENPEYSVSESTALQVQIDDATKEYLNKKEKELGIVFSKGQRAWYYLEKKTQKSKMVQEFPTTPDEAFGTSGNKMYEPEVLERAREHVAQPSFVTPFGLKMFKHFVRGHIYAVGADPSEGVGRDSSTAVVIDFSTGETVATYKNNTIDQVAFAHILMQIGTLYGVCKIAVESNRGMAALTELNQIYNNVYKQMRIGYAETTATEKLGWITNGASKPKMHWELKDAIAEQTLKVLDEEILSEAKVLIKEDLQAVSSTTRHVDLLTATAICYQMRFEAEAIKQAQVQQQFFQDRRAATVQRRVNSFI